MGRPDSADPAADAARLDRKGRLDRKAGLEREARLPPDRAQSHALSPAISRFLSRLDPDLAASFSPEQLAAIDLHFGMRYRHHHAINWRIRLPLRFSAGRRHAYVVLLAGTDRTSP